MAAIQTDVEQVWRTLDALPPAGREIILARLTSKKANDKTFSPPQTLLEDERFLISFEDYLALTDEEGDKLKLLAYQEYQNWIYDELARRRARWMLICGREIIESSPTLNDYPSQEKMDAIGRQLGYAPWTFIANPVIEESYWSALRDNDFYPTLSITVGAASWSKDELHEKGFKIDSDFDTGAGDMMLDYSQMRVMNIVESQLGKRIEYGRHLGQAFGCHVLLVQLAVTNEAGKIISKTLSAVCVRNWGQSPLSFVNPFRKALVGRNLLYEFPLRVELDGGMRTTKILAASS